MKNLKLYINDKEYNTIVKDNEFLLDTLRSLGFISVRRGCETGNCGICSIIIDGNITLSCSTLSLSCQGKRIRTVEGLKEEEKAFGEFLAKEGADQCGYCVPGLVMTTISLKERKDKASDAEIRTYLNGNLCRCSGYAGQIRAIKNYLEVTKKDDR